MKDRGKRAVQTKLECAFSLTRGLASADELMPQTPTRRLGCFQCHTGFGEKTVGINHHTPNKASCADTR